MLFTWRRRGSVNQEKEEEKRKDGEEGGRKRNRAQQKGQRERGIGWGDGIKRYHRNIGVDREGDEGIKKKNQ